MKFYLEIFLTFFKLGAFSFGGGYAMLPLIEREVCEEKKWVDPNKLTDIFSIAGALPGAIALNASTFVGYTLKGIPGAIVALMGSLTPSTLIIIILLTFFLNIKDNIFVQSAFYGIRPAVVALIAYAAVNMTKSGVHDIPAIFIFALSFCLCLIPGVSVISVILISAGLGIVITILKSRGQNHVR